MFTQIEKRAKLLENEHMLPQQTLRRFGDIGFGEVWLALHFAGRVFVVRLRRVRASKKRARVFRATVRPRCVTFTVTQQVLLHRGAG